MRVDTTSLISSSLVCGERGLGVLGSLIPATGDNGPGYTYNDLSLPADNNKEICGRITSWPSSGTLYAYEDTSFEFTGAPNGSYSFQYQLYVDGAATGSPTTVTLQVGNAQTLEPSLCVNISLTYAPTIQTMVGLLSSLVNNSQTFFTPLLVTSNILSAGLFNSSNTIYQPFVSTNLTLIAGLYSQNSSIYGPTAQANYTLNPNLFSFANTFFAANLLTSNSLTTPLYANNQTFYIPTVSIQGGPQQLTVDYYSNASTFYPSSLTPGLVTVEASLYSNTQSIYSLTLTASKTLASDLLVNSTAFYAHVVSLGIGPQVLSALTFDNVSVYFTQSILPGSVSLFPNLLSNTNVIYGHNVSFLSDVPFTKPAIYMTHVLKEITQLQLTLH